MGPRTALRYPFEYRQPTRNLAVYLKALMSLDENWPKCLKYCLTVLSKNSVGKIIEQALQTFYLSQQKIVQKNLRCKNRTKSQRKACKNV